MKGSMTLEASYIFPFCFVVIAIVCYLGIFQYNQAILKMTGYECILQTMEERNQSETTLKEHLLQIANETAKARTIGVKGLEASVKMTVSKISLNYKGTQSMFQIPLDITVVYERTYPELTLRLTKGKTGESNE